ncbi:uncharacterized protein [Nicotiana tomentosiformis]|uniref:uncharacterized protein n=1 Tax=Nicotiana tomentosiformis TaxID=4098 RepID=UPI00388CB77C
MGLKDLGKTQDMIVAPVVAPPAQPARGGVRAGRGRPRGGGQAKLYALPSRTEAIASNSIITDSIVVDCVNQSCLVVIGGFETRVDMLLLSMADFDVILGMDWLSPYHAILDFHTKSVTLAMPGLPRLEWRGALDYVPSRVILFLKARRMVEKWCNIYLAFVRDVSADTPTVESISVVRDFSDVFLADLPGMPPERDIDFCIDLLSGTQPSSIPPYRMAPVKQKELNEQLQEFLVKGFIRPSVSP